MRKVEDYKIEGNFSDLIDKMEKSGGFGAKNLAQAVEILRRWDGQA